MFDDALKLAKAFEFPNPYYLALKILSNFRIFTTVSDLIEGHEEEKKKIKEIFYNETNLEGSKIHISIDYEKTFYYLRDNHVQ